MLGSQDSTATLHSPSTFISSKLAGRNSPVAPPALPPWMSRMDVLPRPASQNEHRIDRAADTRTITAVVAFYWVCSLGVVFLNKVLLSYGEFKFPYPLFVTWVQMLVALGLIIIWSILGRTYENLAMMPAFELRPRVIRQLAPLGVVYVLMLAANNLCLKYVEVTFYQIARSLTILFNIPLSYYLLNTSTSTPAILACLVVFLGFLIGSAGEVNFSWAGIGYGVASSAFVALYGIMVKKGLKVVDGDQWKLMQYTSTMSIVLLGPLVRYSGEWSEIRENVEFLYSPGFLILLISTCLAGFLINISTFLQIKHTSPLTNTISGTAKACFQTILGAMIFRNPISVANAVGIGMSLLGSGWYSFVRYREMQAGSGGK